MRNEGRRGRKGQVGGVGEWVANLHGLMRWEARYEDLTIAMDEKGLWATIFRGKGVPREGRTGESDAFLGKANQSVWPIGTVDSGTQQHCLPLIFGKQAQRTVFSSFFKVFRSFNDKMMITQISIGGHRRTKLMHQLARSKGTWSLFVNQKRG